MKGYLKVDPQIMLLPEQLVEMVLKEGCLKFLQLLKDKSAKTKLSPQVLSLFSPIAKL